MVKTDYYNVSIKYNLSNMVNIYTARKNEPMATVYK